MAKAAASVPINDPPQVNALAENLQQAEEPQNAKNIQLNNVDILPADDWGNVSDQDLLKVLANIEKENEKFTPPEEPKDNSGNILVPTNQNQQQMAPQIQNQALSFNANVNQVRKIHPIMYFPVSTVTINYNYAKDL